MYSIYIYIYIYIYPLLPLTKPRIHKIIQSQKHSLDHLLQFYKVFILFYFFIFTPLPPLVLFWHEDKSLTQAFIETLFFLYQVNKRIIIYQKEVGVPSFHQAFFFSPSIRFNSFTKISQNTPMRPWVKKVSLLAKILT